MDTYLYKCLGIVEKMTNDGIQCIMIDENNGYSKRFFFDYNQCELPPLKVGEWFYFIQYIDKFEITGNYDKHNQDEKRLEEFRKIISYYNDNPA